MKKDTIKTLAFLAISFSIGALYKATDLTVTKLDNYDAVITKNILNNTYKLKIFANSEEFVQPIEHKDVMKIVNIDKKISEQKLEDSQNNLEEAKKQLHEMQILEKLMNNGIELTAKELEDILPNAAKRIKEIDESEKEESEENEPLILNKNKPRMI